MATKRERQADAKRRARTYAAGCSDTRTVRALIKLLDCWHGVDYLANCSMPVEMRTETARGVAFHFLLELRNLGIADECRNDRGQLRYALMGTNIPTGWVG